MFYFLIRDFVFADEESNDQGGTAAHSHTTVNQDIALS